ncbi:MAG: bifunctional methylenetetrahydrofolate dehydrogenase/methenyltetrahydrofolate cyclohydrolase FolD [bacterium]|nr:bifunctional methylenetetrahydrofolate dehydrogenase/methenyltetrahydrofolate cyclohydrolase FolD [bacterium]MDT8365216.1 bifunctional methylenetetrahydrofolate dehydrogenase/methenyltetrahydrofolate cyclohydrolase FolD [bacterium]
MSGAKLIDGNVIAAKVLEEVSIDTAKFRESQGRSPGLAVVLVGEDPASSVYVRMKIRDCGKCGIESFSHKLPVETTTEELLDLVDTLNRDQDVDGLLVQLPLSGHINTRMILDHIDPAKDVDGFNPKNVGKLVRGDEGVLVPCTPAGVMRMLDEENVDPKGKNAVIVGRSDIVGKPMALMLLHRHATVTICHSRTQDLAQVCRTADILVAAVGQPLMIRKDWVREGAVVIDVGMNSMGPEDAPQLILNDPARVADFEKKNYTLVGDVSPDVAEVASLITPVPGGVGPMTRALLMANTMKAAQWRIN